MRGIAARISQNVLTDHKENSTITSLPGLPALVPDEPVGLDEVVAAVAPGEVEVEVLPGVHLPGLQGAEAVGAPVPVLAPARKVCMNT